MRKTVWMLTIVALCGLSFLALAPPDLLAQWGVIQRGVEATRPAGEPATQAGPATKAYEGSASMSDTKTGVSTAPVTYQNKVRSFSYTIPAGLATGAGRPHRQCRKRQHHLHEARDHLRVYHPLDPDGAQLPAEGRGGRLL